VVVGVVRQPALLPQQVARAVHQPAQCKAAARLSNDWQHGDAQQQQDGVQMLMFKEGPQACPAAICLATKRQPSAQAGRPTRAAAACLLRKLVRSVSLLNSERRTEASRTCSGQREVPAGSVAAE